MKMLTKEHGLLSVSRTGSEWDLDPALSQGWTKVSSGGFVSSNYFDLAGMSMEDKTLFFEAAGTQELLNPQLFNVAPGDSVILCDIMTSSPIPTPDAVSYALYGNFAGSQTKLSFDETIYARCHAYSIHVDTGAYGGTTLNSDNQLGSMKPTASDRVYSYRVVLVATVSADRMDLSGCRHILQAKAKEEPDHEYMMRLLRSYQLQQEPDVD